jgi:hypothetical protein
VEARVSNDYGGGIGSRDGIQPELFRLHFRQHRSEPFAVYGQCLHIGYGAAFATGVSDYCRLWNREGERERRVPRCFANDVIDGSFGITSPLFLDQLTPTGTLVSTLAVPTSMVTTSFSSKSEVALNLSADGTALTFMAYVAPPNSVDVSNSNTPTAYDPTNPVGTSYYRGVVQVGANGAIQVTPTNAYSGNNGRAAILANGLYYMAGNGNNGGGTPANIIATEGIQLAVPGQSAATPAIPVASNFTISQVINPATGLPYPPDKAGKDNNFRGLTIFNNTLYTTKGSGGSGVDSMYQVGSGAVPTAANAGSQVFTIPSGFPTTSGSGLYPFGMWFANAYTLYIGDEGQANIPTPSTYSGGVYTQALPASNPTAGLQKWINSKADGSGTWTLEYTLNNGLNLGVPFGYTISNYPTGVNPATGVPWQPANNGLRNIAGQINGDGTVTIYAITSTVSGETDQGADPNELVTITDTLSSTVLPPAETFTVLQNATGLDVLRGVAISTPYTPNLAASFNSPTSDAVTANGYAAGGITLDPITLGFTPTQGEVLTLVNNTGAGPIVGTFTGLPEGSSVVGTFGGTSYYFSISYVGGDGNDVTLTEQGPIGPSGDTDTPALPPWGLAALAGALVILGALFLRSGARRA